MELQMTGTNMTITPEVRRYFERKLGKLNQRLPNLLEIKVEVSEEKTKSMLQHYLVRVTAGGKGVVLHGEERGEDLFRAVDKVAAAMKQQIEHYKGKHYTKKGRGKTAEVSQTIPPPEVATSEHRVVKVKRFVIKPMTLAEAIEQMEILEHSFFLFFDSDEEKLKLLYCRKDGDYGLIEPQLG